MLFHESIFPFALKHLTQAQHDLFAYGVLPIPIFSNAPDSTAASGSPSISIESFPTSADFSSAQIDSPSVPTDHSSVTAPTSRPQRIRKPPSYLSDYYCHSASASPTTPLYPIMTHISYDKLASHFKHFVLSISSHHDPNTFDKVVKDKVWQDVMAVELKALEQNHTWLV